MRPQHRYYPFVVALVSFAMPTVIAGLGWGDYRGGYFYAGVVRLLVVHHSTFCINRSAQWRVLPSHAALTANGVRACV